jgi:hypothetical protein
MALRGLRIGFCGYLLILAAAIPAGLAGSARAMGIGGQDTEQPAPQISAAGQGLAAKLVPRGKSTSIQIVFGVQGGTLAGLGTTDFDQTSRQGVDPKNFRSGLFTLEVVDLAPGAAARLTMRSDFFTSGTRWYVFNPAGAPLWVNAEVEKRAADQRAWELALAVGDGGPLDSDGRRDGRLTVIGGPRDSFWGYALGTLFIRFFGIFIVLSLLMVGMFASGWIFNRLQRRQAPDPASEPPAAAPGPSPETAAAVAVALHLAAGGGRHRPAASGDGSSSWAAAGRMHLMTHRQRIFHRALGPDGKGGPCR